jgi:hypothetical protein
VHHMQCQCGLPALQAWIETSTWIEHQGKQYPYVPDVRVLPVQLGSYTAEKEYEYRLVAAGPDSGPIKTCPQCGRALAQSAKEIEDK